MRRSSSMLRRPTSSADRSASSADAGSRRSTCRALVTWSMTAASPCPTKSWTSRAIRRRSASSACWASSRRVPSSWTTSLLVASDRAADDPGEDDGHDPDADGDLHRILDQGHQHRRGRREHTERRGHPERLRPTRGHEGEQNGIEHERLELSGALRHDHRDDDGEGTAASGTSGAKAHRPKAATGTAARTRSAVDDGWVIAATSANAKREERENTAKVVSLEPTSTRSSSHTPTVLRDSRLRHPRGEAGRLRSEPPGPDLGPACDCRRGVRPKPIFPSSARPADRSRSTPPRSSSCRWRGRSAANPPSSVKTAPPIPDQRVDQGVYSPTRLHRIRDWRSSPLPRTTMSLPDCSFRLPCCLRSVAPEEDGVVPRERLLQRDLWSATDAEFSSRPESRARPASPQPSWDLLRRSRSFARHPADAATVRAVPHRSTGPSYGPTRGGAAPLDRYRRPRSGRSPGEDHGSAR